ncbi:hypothetical protein [Patulibacter defluvii]|uniref:hypothetical protein n=1 Tax=Patulibacter defluvii TaxID=3095358 RepID=UPI002A74BB61|nr:hypothetical protein [Patulibacter sp. DM4]
MALRADRPLPAAEPAGEPALARWVGARALELARGPAGTGLWIALEDPDGGAAGRLAQRLAPALGSLPDVRRLAIDRTVGTGFGCPEALDRALHVAGAPTLRAPGGDPATAAATALRRGGLRGPRPRLLVVHVDDLHALRPDAAALLQRLLFPPPAPDEGSRRPRAEALAPLLLITSARPGPTAAGALADALATVARLPRDRPARFTRRTTVVRRRLPVDPQAVVPLVADPPIADAAPTPPATARADALAVLTATAAHGGPLWFRVARWTAGDLVRLFAVDHRRHGRSPLPAVALAPDDAALAHALWRRTGGRRSAPLAEVATAIRERHRRAWADDALVPGRRHGVVPPGRGDALAALRITLVAHVQAVDPGERRPFALWDAALSAQLLATLCAGNAPELEAAAVRRYLELTAAWERATDEPFDWHAPVAAAWARDWRGLSAGQRARVVDALAARADAAGERRGGALLRRCHGTPACLAAARRPRPLDHGSAAGRADALWRIGELGDRGEPLLHAIAADGLDRWLRDADGDQLRALATAFAARELDPPPALTDAVRRHGRRPPPAPEDPLRALERLLPGPAVTSERQLRAWGHRHADRPLPPAERLRIGAGLLDAALRLSERGQPQQAIEAHAIWRRLALAAYSGLDDDPRGRAAAELTGYRLLRLALVLARAGQPEAADALLDDLRGPTVAGDVLLHLALELAEVAAAARRIDAVARILRTVIRHGDPEARDHAIRRAARIGRLLGADEPRAALAARLAPVHDGLDDDQRQALARALWHGPEDEPAGAAGARPRRGRRTRPPVTPRPA